MSQTWQEWLKSLDDGDETWAHWLEHRYEDLGEAEHTGWVTAEVGDGVPQLARYLFLRSTWKRMVHNLDEAVGTEAAERLVEAGADPADLRALLRQSLGRLATDLLYLLDQPDASMWCDRFRDLREDDPRWALVEVPSEVDVEDYEVTPAGWRFVNNLHDRWGELDPNHRNGADWS